MIVIFKYHVNIASNAQEVQGLRSLLSCSTNSMMMDDQEMGKKIINFDVSLCSNHKTFMVSS